MSSFIFLVTNDIIKYNNIFLRVEVDECGGFSGGEFRDITDKKLVSNCIKFNKFGDIFLRGGEEAASNNLFSFEERVDDVVCFARDT